MKIAFYYKKTNILASLFNTSFIQFSKKASIILVGFPSFPQALNA